MTIDLRDVELENGDHVVQILPSAKSISSRLSVSTWRELLELWKRRSLLPLRRIVRHSKPSSSSPASN